MPSVSRIATVAIILMMAGLGVRVVATDANTAVSAQLAPTGTLRAAINFNNPLLATRDRATGTLSGLAVDLSRELARRLKVPVELIPYDAAGRISAEAQSGKWDIAYMGIDPARASSVEYTGPYLLLEGTYLVPPGSPLARIEDVDRPGVRISVTTGSAYDLYLSRVLKHARIVHADSTPQSIELLLAEKLDAVAAVRTALVSAAKRIPGSRVMDGHFMTIPQAAAVPRGRPLASQFVCNFIEELKSSGFIATALRRNGWGSDDALVAPALPKREPGDPSTTTCSP